MSAIAEALFQPIIVVEPNEVGTGRVLALVQGNVVISTFPGHQVIAAIDLARVLCRALAQPVDIYRINHFTGNCVQAGANADTGAPEWTHLIHVRTTFLSGVEVKVQDPQAREQLSQQRPTP